jgi:hypothetical protein
LLKQRASDTCGEDEGTPIAEADALTAVNSAYFPALTIAAAQLEVLCAPVPKQPRLRQKYRRGQSSDKTRRPLRLSGRSDLLQTVTGDRQLRVESTISQTRTDWRQPAISRRSPQLNCPP